MIFEGAEITASTTHNSNVSGQRRNRVEQYYASLDFSSRRDIEKLLSAYREVVLLLSKKGTTKSVDDLVRRMEQEGFRFVDGRFVPLPRKEAPLAETIREYAATFDLEGLSMQIDRLVDSTESDPALAVGTAKELIETVCKTILEDRGVPADNDDMGKLVRTVGKELSLLPESIPDSAKGDKIIRRVLSNFNQITQGLAELRNLYGTGHGRSGRTGGIQPRHAKLAVGAAVTLATFLLETHMERDLQDSVSQSTNGSAN